MQGISGLEFLGLLFLAGITAGVVALVWRALAPVEKPGGRGFGLSIAPTVQAGAPPPPPWFGIAQDDAVVLGPEARALLGIEESGSTLDAVIGRIAAGRDALDAAIRRLRSEGVAFREMVETQDGRVIEAVGSVTGLSVSISLHDRTALWRRAERAERRAAAAERAEADLEAARAASGLVVWRAGGRDYGLCALPEEARAAIAAAAAEMGEPRRRVLLPGAEDRGYDLVSAPGGLFVAIDATPTIAAERAMSRFVHTVSETFAHLRVGLMIFDADRRLTLHNPAIAELFGDEADWLLRRPGLRDLLDRMRARRALPEQADYAAWRDALLHRTGAEGTAGFEERWHLPDGRSFLVVFRPHASGGLAMILEDVTERVALMRDNAAERAARNATADLLEEGIAIFGPHGRLRTANGAFRRIWGFAEPPVEGAHVDAVIAECAAVSGPNAFWDALRGAASGGGERRAAAEGFALRDGRVLSARISPMPDGATLVVFSDATATEKAAAALRERNEALEQAEEMRSALIDQLSHQMRTPLNSIFGFGQLLETERYGPLTQQQKEYVSGVLDGSRELLEAIRGMADLIAFGPEATEDSRERIDPAEAVEEVADLLGRRAGAGRRIEISREGAPEAALCCRLRFRQVVFNLGLDALTKGAAGGGVYFSVRDEEGDLVVDCAHDVGEELQEQGLALALVRRFVRIEGGAVKIGRDGSGRRMVRCRFPGAAAAKAGAEISGSDPEAKHRRRRAC